MSGGNEVAERQADALAELAHKANEEASLAERLYDEALTHAIECGVALAEVKAALPHGEFEAWLAENFRYSTRHARNFMRLAAHREALLSETATPLPKSAVPSIRQALKLIAETTAERHVGEAAEEHTATRPVEEAEAPPAAAPRLVQERIPPSEISDAMAFAGAAISQLERISDSDPRRDEAIDKVLAWIATDRQPADDDSGEGGIAPPEGVAARERRAWKRIGENLTGTCGGLTEAMRFVQRRRGTAPSTVAYALRVATDADLATWRGMLDDLIAATVELRAALRR